MPTFEFQCLDCQHKFEIFASISKKEKGLDKKCPQCGGENVREIFGGFVLLSQSGEIMPSSGSCCSR